MSHLRVPAARRGPISLPRTNMTRSLAKQKFVDVNIRQHSRFQAVQSAQLEMEFALVLSVLHNSENIDQPFVSRILARDHPLSGEHEGLLFSDLVQLLV